MALVGKVWDGNYSATICVGTLFDVYYYKGFLRWEVFERVLFRYIHKYYICPKYADLRFPCLIYPCLSRWNYPFSQTQMPIYKKAVFNHLVG
jgi:hypothetical protein